MDKSSNGIVSKTFSKCMNCCFLMIALAYVSLVPSLHVAHAKTVGSASSSCTDTGFSHSTVCFGDSLVLPATDADGTFKVSWSESGSGIYLEEFTRFGTQKVLESVGGSPITLTRSPNSYAFRLAKCSKNFFGGNTCVYGKTKTIVIESGGTPPPDSGWEQSDEIWNKKGGSVTDSPLVSPSLSPSNFHGVMPGSAGVSGGAASYTIPISLPPGRNGMQPSVSLNYSNRSGNGIAGVGWSLGAGGAVSRCAATVAQDGYSEGIKFNYDTDKLCMNGQRLVLQSGIYGRNGAIYKTEVDSFVTVTQKGGHLNGNAYFEAALPDGSVDTYGNTSQSTYSRVSPTGTSQTLSWLMSHRVDVSGNNHMAYTYSNAGDGEVLLKHIEYTGNSADSKGDRKVSFEYEDRGINGKYSTSYVAGAFTRQTQRLKEINTYYANSRIKKYTLTYVTSRASKRNLLDSVQECAGSGNTCRNAATFTWQDDPITYKTEALETKDGEAIVDTNASGLLAPINEVVPRGDRNGDGVRDWPKLYVNAEGDKLGNNPYSLNTCAYSRVSMSQRCIDSDFNLDGRTDNWNNDGNYLKISYSNDDGTTQWINTSVRVLGGTFELVNLADYNGDGWPDAVVYESAQKPSGSFAGPVYVYLHTKNIAAPYSTKSICLMCLNAKVWNIQVI